jgi:hypothetical protein
MSARKRKRNLVIPPSVVQTAAETAASSAAAKPLKGAARALKAEGKKLEKALRGKNPGPCGASWRKPAKDITDRQKRIRANQEGCRPAGPKRCKLCGSTRSVVIDHIDGDEANGKPRNLRYLCKSCNTKKGFADARKGKGVRTRQYNPGAKSLGAYVTAAMQHKRGEHDAGGKVIHETPKARRDKFAAQVWDIRRARGNPGDGQDAVAELYRKFHGRDPKEIIQLQVDTVRRKDYTVVGPAAELKIKDPSGERQTLDLYPSRALVCSSPNGRQLYFMGGNQNLDALLSRFHTDTAKDLVLLGMGHSFTYVAAKRESNYRQVEWEHRFGEEGGKEPVVFYDRLNKQIFLAGGTYRVDLNWVRD